MTEISRSALFGKLNKLTYKTIESATLFCKMRGNPHVEIEHWLHQLLQLQDSDLHRILRHFECDAAKLSRDLLETLDCLPRGATSVADFSAYVEESVERGWVYASLLFNSGEVRSGHWLLGMVRTRSLRLNLERISGEFRKISAETLSSQFARLVADSPEAATAGAAPAAAATPAGPAHGGEALARYTVDLTAVAREKKMDPIVGREREIGQIVDILMRRRQNNPILTGEAGVGKTAVVEGLAQRIVAGDVPPPLRDVELRSLDLGLLQAGASMKGEFEARLKQLIDEVQAAAKPIILFIDEAHTLMGAGGAAGTGDAANMLKPELARGTLRTIAATTWAEYKRHIEKDPALTRRFQVVQVAEPSEAHALEMMRSLASSLETHHGVQLLDEALQAAVKLSHRYIPARQLPDKAVSLLDTACARVAISQAAPPAALEAARRRCEALEVERDILLREAATGEDRSERLASVAEQLANVTAERAALTERWQAEQQLVEQVLKLRRALQESANQADDTDSSTATDSPDLAELTRLRAELAELQGEQPLILPRVDAQAVAAVVQDWTGIPVGRMVRDEIDTVLNLADRLGQRIIGQRHALEMIAKRIETSRAGLDNPDKPIGVFLLAGTSGVGKTETALALAELLYGGEQNLITINMSEYQEAHTVSSLKGAPPGYVGYGEGGVLTEAVRRRPYSVVLLDEVEKAHPDVHEIFFQVFDKGWMEDGEGRRISFKNTLIILTTNAGTDTIARFHGAGEIDPETLSKALRPPLLQVFPAALLGRLVTIPYFPLSDAMLQAIIRLQLGRIERRLRENRGVSFSYDDEVVALIGARCTEVESGGRMVDAILTNTVLPAISREFLRRTATGDLPRKVQLRVDNHNFAYDFA